jgi:hypothetical protein
MASRFRRGSRWLAAAGVAGAGLVAAVAASTGAASTSLDTTAATTTSSAPSNTSPPTISGTPQAGNTLTAQNGTWSGSAPITFTYAWERCDENGGSCSDISGATDQTYKLGSADVGNTLRVRVTATNGVGSSQQTTVPTAVVTAVQPPQPPPPATGCSSAPKGQVVDVSTVSAPASLQVNAFQSVPGRLARSTQSFTLKVVVNDSCGHLIHGALVYVTAVPFAQFSIPPEQATGADGSVTLSFSREAGYPASRRQELLALFVRARKPTDNLLSGVTARRLVALPVTAG